MKSIWISVAIVLTLAGLVVTGVEMQAQRGGRGTVLPPPQSGPGILEGIVRRPDTMEPVDGVTITLSTYIPLSPGQAPGQTTAISDINGRFRFSNLALASYNIQGSRTGYFISGAVPGSTPLTSTLAATIATLNASNNTANVVLELRPGGSIAGRVYEADGRLMTGVQIQALYEVFEDGHRRLAMGANGVSSDDRGGFRIWGLAPGRYYLRATSRTASPDPTATIYYRSALDARGAETIDVQFASESLADIRMPAAPLMLISGRVVAADPGTLSPGTRVNYFLAPHESETWDASASAITLAGGARGNPNTNNDQFSFQVSRAPGQYDLIAAVALPTDAATRGFGRTSRSIVGRTLIDLRGNDITDLTIALAPTFDLQVRLVSNGDNAIASQFPAQIRLRPLEQWPASLQPQNAPGATVTGSAVTFAGLPSGRYVLDMPLWQIRDAYVADIRQGNQSIYEEGTFTVGGNQPEPIEVVFKRPAGTIQGIVQDSTGKPVASYTSVVLIPEGPRRQNPLFYSRAAFEPNGQFTFKGVAPGEYKIFAWESIPAGAERNAQFLAPFEQRGRTVSVRAGSTVSNVVVPLIRR